MGRESPSRGGVVKGNKRQAQIAAAGRSKGNQMENKIGKNHYAEAMALSRQPHTLSKSTLITDSFHSLIGDLWVEAIVNRKFKSAREEHAAPLLVYWNDSVPLPNQYSILAWMAMCESAFTWDDSVEDNGIILPQSIGFQFFNEQFDLTDSGLAASHQLPVMRDLRNHFRDHHRRMAESRTELYRGNAFRGPDMYKVSGSGKQMIHIQRPTWHSDEMRATSGEQLTQAWIKRQAILSDVLTPIHSPCTESAMCAVMGATIRGLTRNGLYIKRDGVEPVNLLASGQSVALVHGSDDYNISNVPLSTPFLWFGFTTQEAIDSWNAAYIANRQEAMRRFRVASLNERIGIRNPTWHDKLAKAGVIGGGGATKSASKRQAFNAELDSLINNLRF